MLPPMQRLSGIRGQRGLVRLAACFLVWIALACQWRPVAGFSANTVQEIITEPITGSLALSKCTSQSFVAFSGTSASELTFTSTTGLQENTKSPPSGFSSIAFAWCAGSSAMGTLSDQAGQIQAKVGSSTAGLGEGPVVDAGFCSGSQIGVITGTSKRVLSILSYTGTSVSRAFYANNGGKEITAANFNFVECFPKTAQGQGVAFFVGQEVWIMSAASGASYTDTPGPSDIKAFPAAITMTGRSLLITGSAPTLSVYRYWNGQIGAAGLVNTYLGALTISDSGGPIPQTANVHPIQEITSSSFILLWEESSNIDVYGYLVTIQGSITATPLKYKATHIPGLPGVQQWPCERAVVTKHSFQGNAPSIAQAGLVISTGGERTMCLRLEWSLPVKTSVFCVGPSYIATEAALPSTQGLTPNAITGDMLLELRLPSYFSTAYAPFCPLSNGPITAGRTNLIANDPGVLPEWLNCRASTVFGDYTCFMNSTDLSPQTYSLAMSLAPLVKAGQFLTWTLPTPYTISNVTLDVGSPTLKVESTPPNVQVSETVGGLTQLKIRNTSPALPLTYNLTILNERGLVTFPTSSNHWVSGVLSPSSDVLTIAIAVAATGLPPTDPINLQLTTDDINNPSKGFSFLVSVLDSSFLVLPATPFVQFQVPDYSTLHLRVEGGTIGKDRFTLVAMVDTNVTISISHNTTEGVWYDPPALSVSPSSLSLQSLTPKTVEVFAQYQKGLSFDDGRFDLLRFPVTLSFPSSLPREAFVVVDRSPGHSYASSTVVSGPLDLDDILLVPSDERPSSCPVKTPAPPCKDADVATSGDVVCQYYSVPAGRMALFDLQELDPLGTQVTESKTSVLSVTCREGAASQNILLQSTTTRSTASHVASFEFKLNGTLCTPVFTLSNGMGTYAATFPYTGSGGFASQYPLLCGVEADCAINQFLTFGGSQCQACPRGEVSQGNTTYCTPCAPLLPSSEGICVGCPAGEGDIDGTFTCQFCPQGTVSPDGDPACSFCPPGHIPNPDKSGCDPCPSNTFTSQGLTVCMPCPAGMVCDGSTAVPCPVGHVSPYAASLCTPCSNGTAPDAVDQTCKNCLAGTFAVALDPTCTSCSPGFIAEAPGASECDPCPSGTFAAAAKSTKCLSCEAFEIALPGSSECDTCLPGYVPNGDQSACVSCTAGTFASENAVSCLPCPQGSFSGATARNCTACAPGHVASSAGSPTCEPCTAGRYAVKTVGGVTYDGGVQCEVCPDGTVAGPGASICQPCPDGYMPNHNKTQCIPCLAGSYAEAGAVSCRSCDPGTYSLDTARNCSACSLGYVASTAGTPVCDPCTAGRFAVNIAGGVTYRGGVQCEACADNKVAGPAAYECQPCSAGYAPNQQRTQCVSCLAGTYAEGGAVSCRSCDPGTYSLDTAQNCSACALGYVASTAGSPVCDPCTAGRFAVNVVGGVTYRGGVQCEACPDNKVAGPAAYECQPCSAGYVPNKLRTQCVSCLAGTYADAGAVSCRSCDPGTYSLDTAQNCSACALGYVASTAGSPVCEPCSAGRYSVNRVGGVTYSGGVQCEACADNKVAGPAAYECQPCSAGYVPNSNRTQCVSCLAGTYADAGAVSCKACAPGTYSLDTARNCSACPLGYVASAAGTAVCEACTAGRYAVNVASGVTYAGGVQCEGCPNGRVAGPGAAQCTPCPDGHIPNNNKTQCLRCEPGSVALSGASTCTSCRPGFYANAEQSMCEPCAVGTMSAADASECAACPAGRFAALVDNNPAFEGRAVQCLGCSPGTYSEGRVAACRECLNGYAPDAKRTQCIICPPGYFAAQGDEKCTPCPAGEYQDLPGQAQCRDCISGTYSDQLNTTECKLCPRGYITSFDGAKSCSPCPPGTVSPDEGGRYCQTCEIGTVTASSGAAKCQRCESGLVALRSGLTQCTRCNDGFYPSSDGTQCFECANVAAEYCSSGVREFLPDFWSEYNLEQLFGNRTVTEDGLVMSNALFHECSPGACNMTKTGNPQCAGQRQGPICTQCDRGWYPTKDGSCLECLDSLYAWLAVASILIGMVVLVSMVVGNSKGTRSITMGIFRILINFAQLTTSVGSFAVKAPEIVSELMGFTSASDGLSVDSGFIQCEFSYPFYLSVYVAFATPFFALMLPLVVIPLVSHCAPMKLITCLLFRRTARRGRIEQRPQGAPGALPAAAGAGFGSLVAMAKREKNLQAQRTLERQTLARERQEADDAVKKCRGCQGALRYAMCIHRSVAMKEMMILWKTTAVVFLFLLYMPITKVFLRVFNIYPRAIQGSYRLRDAMMVTVFSPPHTVTVIISGIGLVLFTIGIPLFAFLSIRRKHRRGLQRSKSEGLASIEYRRIFGFLYLGYDINRGLYWWEVLVLLRKVSIAGLAVFSVAPYAQSFISLFLLSIFTMLNVYARPFTVPVLNALETLSLATSMFTQMGSIMYAQSVVESRLLTYSLLLLNAGTLLVFCVCILLSMQVIRLRFRNKRGCRRILSYYEAAEMKNRVTSLWASLGKKSDAAAPGSDAPELESPTTTRTNTDPVKAWVANPLAQAMDVYKGKRASVRPVKSHGDAGAKGLPSAVDNDSDTKAEQANPRTSSSSTGPVVSARGRWLLDKIKLYKAQLESASSPS